MMKIDMHTHTLASDGNLSCEQLIDKAINEGINVISITDHDSLDAYDNVGIIEKSKIRLIPGIELSTRLETPIHILGYNIDVKNENLLFEIDKVRSLRTREIKEIVKKLKENLSNDISLKDIIIYEKKLNIESIAHYLFDKGYCDSVSDAHTNFLDKGCCGYVQKECMEPKRAIQLIKEAGGFAVLAHPNRIYVDEGRKLKIIESLIEAGLDGIEVFCKGMDKVDYYLDLCNRKKLLISGGSDFHTNEDNLGCWACNELIPDNVFINSFLQI